MYRYERKDIKLRGKDIEIGKEYRIGYGVAGRVLAKQVPTVSWRGTHRNDGVQVELIHPESRKGETAVYTSRDIKEPWEAYASRKRAETLRRQLRDEAVAARRNLVDGYEEKINSRGIQVERIDFARWEDMDTEDFSVTIRLNSQQVEKLIAALGQTEAQQNIADYQPPQKEQEVSALAQMFGAAS